MDLRDRHAHRAAGQGVSASRQTHSPSGGRRTWTVSSVLRKPHSARVEDSTHPGGGVGAGHQPLDRRDPLTLDQVGRTHPHHPRPGVREVPRDPPPVDRVDVAAAPSGGRSRVVPSSGPWVGPTAPVGAGPRRPGTARPGRSRPGGRARRRTARRRPAGPCARAAGPTPRPRGPTGTGPSSSIVNRPMTASDRPSIARASNPAGGPPCWLSGPTEAVERATRSPPGRPGGPWNGRNWALRVDFSICLAAVYPPRSLPL